MWAGLIVMDDLDAFIRRMDYCVVLLVKRGGFQSRQASKALASARAEDKEPIAQWLRMELKNLRESEKKIGTAPVLIGGALSRLTIADLTMTMLETCNGAGENLICLLHELLDVDRHRKALADKRSKQFDMAARIEAETALQGKQCGVRELARMVGASGSTVLNWRRDPEYQSVVQMEKDLLDGSFIAEVRKAWEARSKK
jgi:hypothetical protein